jgi:hypothetical protein
VSISYSMGMISDGFCNVLIFALFNCIQVVWHFTCFVWVILHILLLCKMNMLINCHCIFTVRKYELVNKFRPRVNVLRH